MHPTQQSGGIGGHGDVPVPPRHGDDLIALYASRVRDRPAAVRAVVAERRAFPGGGGSLGRLPDRIPQGLPATAIGRGTVSHRAAVRAARPPVTGPAERRQPRHAGAGLVWARPRHRIPEWQAGNALRFVPRRRLLTAGLALLLLLAGAGSSLAQHRYEVQPGDTVDGVAATFGVDPAAILAASWVEDPANLAAGSVIVIPDPGQSPGDAAAAAAAREGTSPFVATAHRVAEGDVLDAIAAGYGLTADAVAAFNAITDPDALEIGQRLLIPPSREIAGDPEAVVLAADGPEVAAATDSLPGQAAGQAFVSNVGTYVQQRNLSCEYAAAFIATAAFGAGVPEPVFWDATPLSANPHWGYRGNIDGWWGNTDDYGIYPEALAPTLNANGFAADVFYGLGDPTALTARLDAGVPTLVWLGFWGDTAVTLDDAGVYTVAAGEHVVVAYGYDANGVHVSDPASGTLRFFAWDHFLSMWNVLDGMSLGVSPA